MTTPRTKPWRRRTVRPRRPDVVVADGAALAQITIYPDVTILTRRHGRTWRQHPVSPAALAETLARVPTTSGLLPPNTLGTGRLHGDAFVVVYVPPQRVTLRMERSRYSIPLPPLVWAGWRDQYRVWALGASEVPTTERTPLLHAPFPNVYTHGGICWGDSDTRPPAAPGTLLSVLKLFLSGSYFNLHLANGKSRAFPNSVAAQWGALRKAKADAYPLGDLMPAGMRTLADVLSGQVWRGAL